MGPLGENCLGPGVEESQIVSTSLWTDGVTVFIKTSEEKQMEIERR